MVRVKGQANMSDTVVGCVCCWPPDQEEEVDGLSMSSWQ